MSKKSVKGSGDGFVGKSSCDTLPEAGEAEMAKNIFQFNTRHVTGHAGGGITGCSTPALSDDELRMRSIKADDLGADNMRRNIVNLLESAHGTHTYYFVRRINAATLMEILKKC